MASLDRPREGSRPSGSSQVARDATAARAAGLPARVRFARPAVFGLLFLSLGGSFAAAGAEIVPALPAKGHWQRLLSLTERQEIVEATGHRPQAGEVRALKAQVRWRVARRGDRTVSFQGEVEEGAFELGIRPAGGVESRYAFLLDGLRFRLDLEEGNVRLRPDARKWRELVATFRREQAPRKLPRSLLRRLQRGALSALERAHRIALWPLVPGTLPEGAATLPCLEFPLELDPEYPARIVLEPVEGARRYFAGGTGKEVPFVRLESSADGPEVPAGGEARIAWTGRPLDVPETIVLEAEGPWRADRYFARGSLDPKTHSPRHTVHCSSVPPGKHPLPLEKFTGLPRLPAAPPLERLVRRPAERRRLALLLAKSGENAASLIDLLETYARTEAESDGSLEFRAALHFALAERLAYAAWGTTSERPGTAGARAELLRRIEEESRGPPLIVAARAALHPYAPVPLEDRRRLAGKLAARSEFSFARWAGLLLGRRASREDLEILVGLLEEIEKEGKRPSLARSLRLDLQARLGAGAYGAPPQALRRLIQEEGPEAPERPFTHTGAIGVNARTTYFAEAALLDTVFALDVSRSAALPRPGAELGGLDPSFSRLAWIRYRLAEAFPRFPKDIRTAWVLFGRKVEAVPEELVRPDPAVLQQVIERLDRPRSESRGDVLRALRRAFQYKGADCIVLYAGSEPQSPAQLEAALLLWNYLRGARIVTYTFVERPQEFQGPLGTLERIAYQHFGWHRILR